MQNLAIIVNKPTGLTSRGVVNKLNKILNTKKIGHTGTLDPLASGVLVCLIGKYTKLVDVITSEEKEYIAEIKLGIETDTGDITGSVIKEEEPTLIEFNFLQKVLESFVGEFEQTIPIYSAVHVNGKRLYEYARNNEVVELPKNIVQIKEIELLNYQSNLIKFRVKVSKGTYIRSLIQSICEKLNIIGTMNSLVRTKQGKFTLENSYTLEEIENNNYQSLQLSELIDLKEVIVDSLLEKKIINGCKLNLDYEGFVLFKNSTEELALYFFENKLGVLKILLKND